MKTKTFFIFSKKFISIILIFALLMNTMPGNLFAKGTNGGSINDKMMEMNALVSEELFKVSQQEAQEKYAEAISILTMLRWKVIQDNAQRDSGAEKFNDLVLGMIKVLYPFEGEPIEVKGAGYPKSKYFKEAGSLYQYLLQLRLHESTGGSFRFLGAQSKKDHEGQAEVAVRNLFILGSKNKVAIEAEEEKHDNAINDALLMLGYEASLKDGACWGRAEEIRHMAEAFGAAEGKSEEDIARELNEDIEYQVCKRTKGYDNNVLKQRGKEIKEYSDIASTKAARCVKEVLMELQAGTDDISFGDIRSYLEKKGERLNWGLCGVSKKEGIDLIVAGTLTKEEAEKEAKNVQRPENFWNRVFLDSWKYLSVSHYVGRSENIESIETKYAKESEGLSGNEKNRAHIRGIFLANSLNENLVKISANLLLYGQVFTYGGVLNSNSSEYAKELYTISALDYYIDTPISALGRGILHNGGFSKYSNPKSKEGRALYNKEQKKKYLDNLDEASKFLFNVIDFMVIMVGFEVVGQFAIGARVWGLVRNTKAGRAISKVGNTISKADRAFTGWMGEALGVPGYGERYWAELEASVGRTNTAVKAASEVKPKVKVAEIEKPKIWDPGTISVDGKVYSYNATTEELFDLNVLNGASNSGLTATVGEGGGGAVASGTESKGALNKFRQKGGVKIGSDKHRYYISKEKGRAYDAEIKLMKEQTANALANPAKPNNIFGKSYSQMNSFEKFITNTQANADYLWRNIREAFTGAAKNPARTLTSAVTFNVGEAPAITSVPVEIVETVKSNPITLFDIREIPGSIRMNTGNLVGSSMKTPIKAPEVNTVNLQSPKIGLLPAFTILPTDVGLVKRQKIQARQQFAGLAAATTAALVLAGALNPLLGAVGVGTVALATAPLASTDPNFDPKATINTETTAAATPAENVVKSDILSRAVEANNVVINENKVKARAVWELKDKDGNIIAYAKYTTPEEIETLKKLDEVVTKKNLRERYNLLNIEYPEILTEDIASLNPELAKAIQEDFERIKPNVRDANKRATNFFVMTPISKGFYWGDKQLTPATTKMAMNALKGTPITVDEWKQYRGFILTLNNNDVENIIFKDLINNAPQSRESAEAKLTCGILDVEGNEINKVKNNEEDLNYMATNYEKIGAKEKKGKKKGNKAAASQVSMQAASAATETVAANEGLKLNPVTGDLKLSDASVATTETTIQQEGAANLFTKAKKLFGRKAAKDNLKLTQEEMQRFTDAFVAFMAKDNVNAESLTEFLKEEGVAPITEKEQLHGTLGNDYEKVYKDYIAAFEALDFTKSPQELAKDFAFATGIDRFKFSGQITIKKGKVSKEGVIEESFERINTVFISSKDFKLKEGESLVMDSFGNVYKLSEKDGKTIKEYYKDVNAIQIDVPGLNMPIVVVGKTINKIAVLNFMFMLMGFSSLGRFVNGPIKDLWPDLPSAVAMALGTGIYFTNLLAIPFKPLIDKLGAKKMVAFAIGEIIVASLLPSLFGMAGFNAIDPTTTRLAVLATSSLLYGSAAAGLQQVVNTTANNMLNGKEAGYVTAGGQMWKSVGSLSTYLFYAVAVGILGAQWPAMYWLMGVPGAIGAGLLAISDLPFQKSKIERLQDEAQKGNQSAIDELNRIKNKVKTPSNAKKVSDLDFILSWGGLPIFLAIMLLCGSETLVSVTTKGLMKGWLGDMAFLNNEALQMALTGIITMGPALIGRLLAKNLMKKYKDVPQYNQKMLVIAAAIAVASAAAIKFLGPSAGLAGLLFVITSNMTLANFFTFANNIMKGYNNEKFGGKFDSLVGTLTTMGIVGCFLVPTLSEILLPNADSFGRLIVPMVLIPVAMAIMIPHLKGANPLNWKKPMTAKDMEKFSQSMANNLNKDLQSFSKEFLTPETEEQLLSDMAEELGISVAEAKTFL